MSHYSVLVIGEYVQFKLAPFDENLEVPEYTKGQLGSNEIKSFIETYATYEKDKNYGAKSKKEAEENGKLSLEELYEKYGKDWNGNSWRKDEKGILSEYSTYNPKSKWDWFEVGGRWAGKLKLKKGVDKSQDDNVNFSGGWDEEDKEEILTKGFVDSALKKDIDFSPDKEAYDKAIRFWEMKVEGSKPINDEEKKILEWNFYKKEYYEKRYGTKERYAKQISSFSTYAVLKNGVWYESGEMGWFGMNNATPEEEGKFKDNFYDKFIKELPDRTKLTIVDCHI